MGVYKGAQKADTVLKALRAEGCRDLDNAATANAMYLRLIL